MRNRQRSTTIATLLAFVGGLILLGLLTWVNYRFAKDNPGGNDFLVHYVGTRALVTEGANPYSDEVALKIQTAAYGRAAEKGEHELRVAYPLYSVLVFLPFSLIADYTMARAVWMTALEVGLLLLALFSIRLARWRIGALMIAFMLIFSVLWYHGLRPLINGNAVILVALGLVGGFLAIRAGADELAGVLFALTTIKPQVVVLVLAFVVIWALSKGRMRIVGWLFATTFLLALGAALLIPDWIIHNFREVLLYPSYNPPGTPRAAFIEWWPSFGSRVGWALTGAMASIVLVEWWNNRKADFKGFYWTACLTLAAGQWIGIQTDPGNFIVLLPALILAFSLLDERWRLLGRMMVIVSTLALFAGLWALFINTVETINGQPVQSAVMFFPLPAFLLVALYWVRWWAIEPPTVWYDRLGRL